MTVARGVADVLAEHTVFEVECIDRMYLNVYQPRLQYAAGLVGYVHRQLGLPIASTAPLAGISDRFARAVHRFAETEGIPWVDFVKGQRKDDVMQERLKGFTAPQGVVFIGRAQEKTRCSAPRSGATRTGLVSVDREDTGVVNQFYFYCVDADFGPFFLKFCSYFPYTAKLCINGNHWAQRQPRQHPAVGAKPLPRKAVMRDLAFEIRNDALLPVRLRLGDDAGRATHPRVEAVRTHDEAPGERTIVGERQRALGRGKGERRERDPVMKSMPGT